MSNNDFFTKGTKKRLEYNAVPFVPQMRSRGPRGGGIESRPAPPRLSFVMLWALETPQRTCRGQRHLGRVWEIALPTVS